MQTKARDNISAFRRKHPQIAPNIEEQGGPINEKEGGGELARLLNSNKDIGIQLSNHCDNLWHEITISLVLHLNEMCSQAALLWASYNRIFKAMLDSLKNAEFLKCLKEHDERKLKKNQISNRIAQQEQKKRELRELVDLTERILTAWGNLCSIQSESLFILYSWICAVEKNFPPETLSAKAFLAPSLDSIKSFTTRWLYSIDPHFATRSIPQSVNVKEKVPLPFESYIRLEKRLKDQGNFFDQLVKRSEDVQHANMEALDIMRIKGGQSLYYEKAQQKVNAIVEDNRKHALNHIVNVKMASFIALQQLSSSLEVVFRISSVNFSQLIESSKSPSPEVSMVGMLPHFEKLEEDIAIVGRPSRSYSLKKFQKEREQAMGSIPSISLHPSGENINEESESPGQKQSLTNISEGANQIDKKLLVPVRTGSKRHIVDLSKEPSYPSAASRRRSSLPVVTNIPPNGDASSSLYRLSDKPPPPIPQTTLLRYGSLKSVSSSKGMI